MKKIITVLLFLLPVVVIGQNNTYLGIEIGPKFDVYEYVDNGNSLYTKPFLFSPIFGLSIGHELDKTFIFETGFFINDYGESYRIRGDIGYSASNALFAYQIPLRLKARLKLIEGKLDLVTTVGYTFAINSEFDSSGSGSGFSSNTNPQYNDSTRTESISSYNFEKTYGLIETGIALEYKLKKSLKLFLSANYLTGLNKVVEVDVKYWINDGPEQSGTVFSNGDYYSITFGLKYPISNFWTDKTKD